MKTIVHGFFTNGYFELAKLFTESFFMFNKNYCLVLDAISITDEQTSQLDKIAKMYDSDLYIFNTRFNYEKTAQQLGIPLDTLKSYQYEVENNFGLPAAKVDLNAKVWKLLMAGDMRVKCIHRLLPKFNVINFDIDTLFRGPINRLEELANTYDVSAKIRLHNPANMAISIGLVVYQSNEKTLAWMEKWIEIIDSITPMKRPLGFGQTSCFRAYEKFKNKMTFYDLIENEPQFGQPWVRAANDIIWTANTHGIAKKEYIKIFGDELRRLQK